MGTSGHTGEIDFSFTIDPGPEQVTLSPGGASARVGVRVTPVGQPGAGQVRVVVGVDPDSGLTFPRNSLTVDSTDYPAGADARDDVLSFDAVTIDSDATPELSVEVTAGEQTPPEPTAVLFAVGSASCSVPVIIAGDD
ncbi:hypothetical protein ACFV4K_25890 [Nocardia sp. NPDC059764]|uniref:hypothetical protein n=1 Tax=Nocardia sp. NPDC059764 TaxID=3346939 RepID=UPI003655CB4A